MTQLTVYKLDDKGVPVWSYPARELARRHHMVRLEAFFNRDDIDLGFATFARGDRFVEYFYSDRWYNIFAVYVGDSARLKGWYCNICRPATLGHQTITCEDLALDLWVTPDGQAIVLDEEEFAALALTAEERTQARAALADLLALSESGRLPR
jgi:hypothetical protein